MKEDNRSAVWGGATAGLLVGLVLGFFIEPYGRTLLYSIVLGLALGIVANALGLLSDRLKR